MSRGKSFNTFYNLYISKIPHSHQFYDLECMGLALTLEDAKEWVSKDPEHRKYKFNKGVIYSYEDNN